MTIASDIQNSSKQYKEVTVTIASPSIFTYPFHGLCPDDRVQLATTGALPTGFSEGTYYYVIQAGLTEDTFELSASKGGSAINGSGSQSGTHYFAVHRNSRFTIRRSGNDSNQ